jgi:hypothetical protein
MGLLKWLFYMCMIIPVLCELEAIFSTKKMLEFGKKIRDIGKLSHDEKMKALTSDKELSTLVFMQLFYLTWLFFGLFSTLNWPIFLFLLLSCFIPKRNFVLRFADGVISFSLLIFAFLNAFHFHYPILNFLIKRG